MARKKTKQRPVIGRQQGMDLAVLTGIPLEPLLPILDMLAKDMTKGHVRFEGVATTQNDWADLYRKSTLDSIQSIIGSTITKNSSASEPTPRGIFVLYVPSRDSGVLVEKFGMGCYLEPLMPFDVEPSFRSDIAWRHKLRNSLDIIFETLQRAITATDQLEEVITDKGRSAFALPPMNFYFPDEDSPIYETYLSLARREIPMQNLIDSLIPKRFTNDQLPGKALKGDQPRDRFFQDKRGRIFPPDIYHGPSRIATAPDTSSGVKVTKIDQVVQSETMQVINQRYRFGVVARDGHLHYDVQYESPKRLYNEPMYCAATGKVRVTGTHANVGVNDVIWVPDGRKKPA